MHLRSFLATTVVACASILSSGSAWGMAQKPKVTVRLNVETNSQDGTSFAVPIKLRYHRRDAYLSRIPVCSENNITGILPFRAADGTWGCVFQFDPSGRINLETTSNENRGRAIVVFIGTQKGMHQVVDMTIDRSVSDGVITVPSGITDLEAYVLQQQFKVLGQDKKKKKEEPKKEAPTDYAEDRARAHYGASRRNAPEPTLPRQVD